MAALPHAAASYQVALDQLHKATESWEDSLVMPVWKLPRNGTSLVGVGCTDLLKYTAKKVKLDSSGNACVPSTAFKFYFSPVEFPVAEPNFQSSLSKLQKTLQRAALDSGCSVLCNGGISDRKVSRFMCSCGGDR